jgi:hypothetical protein
VRFSRHAKNRMRLYQLSAEEIEGCLVPGNLVALDKHGHPIFEGRAHDGRPVEVVLALDAPDFVITVFSERE